MSSWRINSSPGHPIVVAGSHKVVWCSAVMTFALCFNSRCFCCFLYCVISSLNEYMWVKKKGLSDALCVRYHYFKEK